MYVDIAHTSHVQRPVITSGDFMPCLGHIADVGGQPFPE